MDLYSIPHEAIQEQNGRARTRTRNATQYTGKQLVHLRVTREKGGGLEIDLLLVHDGQEYH